MVATSPSTCRSTTTTLRASWTPRTRQVSLHMQPASPARKSAQSCIHVEPAADFQAAYTRRQASLCVPFVVIVVTLGNVGYTA